MGLSARKLGKLSGAKKSFQHPQLNEEARRYRTCVGGRTPHPKGGVLFVEVTYGSQPKRSRKSPPIAGFLAASGKSREESWATGEAIVPEAGIRDLPGPEPTP
jgi:hypothetical protein